MPGPMIMLPNRFTPEEVLARLRAILRRAAGQASPEFGVWAGAC